MVESCHAFSYNAVMFSRTAIKLTLSLWLLALAMVDANAQTCQTTFHGERAKLERLLASRSYTKSESKFLLLGAQTRVQELKQSSLNERGSRCGIQAVRANVFGCVAAQLPSPGSPDRQTGTSLWGKSNVSAREAAFIGIFHACRGAAVEALFKG